MVTKSPTSMHCLAVSVRRILRQSAGRWSVMGFLMILSSFSGPFVARMENFCSSCTARIELRKGRPHRDRGSARTHQGSEALERSWYPRLRVHLGAVSTQGNAARTDLDEDPFLRLNVHLQQAGLVERAVQQHEQALRPA